MNIPAAGRGGSLLVLGDALLGDRTTSGHLFSGVHEDSVAFHWIFMTPSELAFFAMKVANILAEGHRFPDQAGWGEGELANDPDMVNGVELEAIVDTGGEDELVRSSGAVDSVQIAVFTLQRIGVGEKSQDVGGRKVLAGEGTCRCEIKN